MLTGTQALLLIAYALIIGLFERLKENYGNRYLFLAFAALAIGLANIVVEKIGVKASEPKVRVVCESGKPEEIDISVETSSNLESIAISYPVFGEIINVHKPINAVEVGSIETYITGFNTSISLNHVDISVSSVYKDKSLHFKVFYRPANINFDIAGMNTYTYRYTWLYNGNKFEKEIYKSTITNEEIDPPGVFVGAFRFNYGAMGSAEVKEMYISGIPRIPVESLPINTRGEASYFENKLSSLSLELGSTADSLISLGKYPEAVYLLDKAIEFKENLPQPYFSRAQAYLNLREYNKALEDYNHALALGLNHSYIYLNKSFILSKFGDDSAAIDVLNGALKIHPNNINLLWNLAIIHVKLHNYQEAIITLNTYIENNSKNPRAYLLRSQSFQQVGKSDLSIKDLESSAALGDLQAKEILRKLRE